MNYKKYILLAILAIAVFTITACQEETQQENTTNLGGDVDEFGCKPSAGYTWCPSLNECVRVWETLCPEYEEQYREPSICTREYMPVTGEITIPCADGECEITETFGNRCEAESAGAKNIQPLNEDIIITTVTNFNECVAAGNPIMESMPRQCIHDGELFIEEISYDERNLPEDKYEACTELGGNALPEYSECEYISQDMCEYLNGEYRECESACRNDEDADFCTMQCVQVCSFN